MLRYPFALLCVGFLACRLDAGALSGTVIGVGKTGFTLQTEVGPKWLQYSDHQLKDIPSPHGRVFDDIYRIKVADVREGMEVLVEYRIVKREWVCQGIRPVSAEIDFNRLAKVSGKYTLRLTLVAADGTKFEKCYDIEAGSTVQAVRDKVQRSLQPVPPPKERWAVCGWGKNYLAIDGYIKGDKFSPIKKIEVSCPDLKAEQQPLFKQKGKPWPK
jgi:hypothetical protein